MKLKIANSYRVLAVAALCALLCLAGISNAAEPDRTPYTKTIQALYNGYGITRIAETREMIDQSSYYNRLISGGAISSAEIIDSNTYKVFGAQTDFGDTPTISDVVGFSFTFDPNNPDMLSVWKNWTWTSSSSAVSDCGIGGVSQDGKIGLRLDGYNTGYPGSAIGFLDGTSTSTSPTVLSDYSSADNWTKICGSDTCYSVVTPPGVGGTDNIMAYSSFDNFVAAGRVGFTPTGSSCSNVCAQDVANGTHRGLVCVNSTAKKMAILVRTDPDPYQIRYISYTDTATGILATEQICDFKEAIPGKWCSGCSYHGSTGFRGPGQISMNDLGDIAFPVSVISIDSESNDMEAERAILFMDHSTPGQFKVVTRTDDGSASPLLLYDATIPVGLFFSGVAIDNQKNVFFGFPNWVGFDSSGDVWSNCIFKATANDSSNPITWGLEPILWRGCTWRDAEDGKVYEISYIPMMVDGGNAPSPSGFNHAHLNRTPILGNSIGGFLVPAGLGDDTSGGLKNNACYVAPTNGTPNAGNIATAKTLANGEPVNLLDCVIVGFGTPYYDQVWGNTYYQCYVADKSYGRIRVSTIRADVDSGGDLEIGDRIYVSGTVESEITGEKWLESGGLVLVAKDDSAKPIAMTNKAVGTGYGLSTMGRWVKVFGVVGNITVSSFTVDDGSATPVSIQHDGSVSVVSGKYVSVTGDVIADKTVLMTEVDEVKTHN